MITDVDQIDDMIRHFEQSLKYVQRISFDEVTPLITVLGGDIEAVRGCSHGPSLCAYIAVLTVRHTLTHR
jgi:hypothetical protein